MDSYTTTAIRKILAIYCDKALSFTETEQKLVCIGGLFDYLSTATVKPLLLTAPFANYRKTLMQKISDFTNDPYVQARPRIYHRLHAVMRELFTYMVQDDTVPRRRSERQKQQAVQRFNARFQECPCNVTAELNYWTAVAASNPLPTIRVKVLPRRSARLMAQLAQ